MNETMYLITYKPCGTQFLVNIADEEKAFLAAVDANQLVGSIEGTYLSDKSNYNIEDANFDTLVSLFCKGGYWGWTDNVIIFVMERIDCEKCIQSFFDGDDKLRCICEDCTPDYPDMREAREALIAAFPGSFINENGEFIAHVQPNEYFSLKDCNYPEDIDCKILEWLSRSASKGMWYSTRWRNEKFRKFIRNGINNYLDTNFSEEQFLKIYTHLGNAVNHELTKKFIESNYDFSVFE